MSPIVLEEIVATAVRYALKEYCEEEGCPWDEEYISSNIGKDEKNILEEYYDAKLHFYEVWQMTYLPKVSQIRHNKVKRFKYPHATFKNESSSQNRCNEAEAVAKPKIAIINDAIDKIEAYTVALDDILLRTSYYDDLVSDETDMLDSADMLIRQVSELCHKKMFKRNGLLI
ncbi:MAG: hypothetical protein L3J43_04020 [Sulfurovum sp.]|nr:hypothetical protein [Sulfurovum sp.]